MHSDHHPTWETTLVIPETSKTVEERTLDAVLRIEVLLEQLLGQRNVVTVEGDLGDLLSDIEPTETPFTETLKKPAKKAKAK
jgi:hypothetical protein